MERTLICFMYILELLIIYLLNKRYFCSLRTPITFFSTLWCLVGLLSNMKIYGYYPPSFFVNITIMVGALVFFIAFCGRVRYGRTDINEEWKFGYNETIRYQWIYIVNILGIVIIIPKLINSIRIIRTYGMVFIRANLTNQTLGISFGGIYDNLVFAIIRPIFIGTGILACVLIFNQEKSERNYRLFLFSIVLIILYCMSDASRGALIEFIFCLVFVVMICKRNLITELLKNKLILIGFIIAVVAVLYISSERTSSDSSGISNVLKTIYIYYCSGPVYLTKLLEAKPEYALGGQLLYGSASFGFITNIISWILIILTGKQQGSQYLLGTVITNTYFDVAPGVKINSMATCFYSFLIDWGYLGIVIGPMILGFVSGGIFNRAYKKQTYYSCCLYVFWLYILIRTLFKLDTLGFDLPVVMLSLRFFIGREDKALANLANL